MCDKATLALALGGFQVRSDQVDIGSAAAKWSKLYTSLDYLHLYNSGDGASSV